MSQMLKLWTLAFDIEMSGQRKEHDILAIGMSVVDDKFTELGSLLIKMYLGKDKTNFDPRTWSEFWEPNEGILDLIKYDGPITSKKILEFDAIQQFLEFKKNWEEKARKERVKIILVSDNPVFDGGFINGLIFDYTKELPIPYNSFGEYDSFLDVGSEERGFIMGIIEEIQNSSKKRNETLNRLYVLPEQKKQHTHLPNEDAYVIAYRYQVLVGILHGIIPKRNN